MVYTLTHLNSLFQSDTEPLPVVFLNVKDPGSFPLFVCLYQCFFSGSSKFPDSGNARIEFMLSVVSVE